MLHQNLLSWEILIIKWILTAYYGFIFLALTLTEQGEVKVKVWEINKNRIDISVIDTGIGIAPENREKIFQAFRQEDQSFTRQHSGTGLGLAITESLVKMMGGKIYLASKLGEGSTFTVEIPRKYDA